MLDQYSCHHHGRGSATLKTAVWAWRLHRALVDRVGYLRPFSKRTAHKRLLFISEHDPICHAQLFPFFYHAHDIAQRHDMEMRELPFARFKQGHHPYLGQVDAVCFQTWFDLTPETMDALAKQIHATWPNAKIAYFDWFAPTDLRYAEVLDPHIVAYVKKQIFKDLNQYSHSTLGDTNLMDYYSRGLKTGLQETHYIFPDGFKNKLLPGTHFAFTDPMLTYFLKSFPTQKNRSIDLHARIAVKGTEWYTRMRQIALDKSTALEGRLNVMCRGRVTRKKFFKELFDSKLCFSPFGYGEVCWRDFEAMFTGSLLLKPDMSHLTCYPEVFFPNETYVSLAWDLSDFEEKVDFYLANPQERERITRNAFEVINNCFKQKKFLEDVLPLLTLLEVAA